MDCQVPGPRLLEPVQHRCAGMRQGLRPGSPRRWMNAVFHRLGFLQPRIHHVGRFDRALHGGDEISVAFAKQIAHDHGMGMLKLLRGHDIRMGVDPEHGEVSVVPFVQVGEWRKPADPADGGRSAGGHAQAAREAHVGQRCRLQPQGAFRPVRPRGPVPLARRCQAPATRAIAHRNGRARYYRLATGGTAGAGFYRNGVSSTISFISLNVAGTRTRVRHGFHTEWEKSDPLCRAASHCAENANGLSVTPAVAGVTRHKRF